MIRSVLLLLILFASICAVPKTKYQRVPMHLDHDGEKWAEKTLRKMSVEEKVGQLFMVWVRAEFLNAKNPEYAKLRDEINRYHVGSFAMSVPYEPPFLYKSGPYEAADLLNRLQSDSKLPLLIAADFDLGVSNRLRGATSFPNAMAIVATGQTKYTQAVGHITAEDTPAIGAT